MNCLSRGLAIPDRWRIAVVARREVSFVTAGDGGSFTGCCWRVALIGPVLCHFISTSIIRPCDSNIPVLEILESLELDVFLGQTPHFCQGSRWQRSKTVSLAPPKIVQFVRKVLRETSDGENEANHCRRPKSYLWRPPKQAWNPDSHLHPVVPHRSRTPKGSSKHVQTYHQNSSYHLKSSKQISKLINWTNCNWSNQTAKMDVRCPAAGGAASLGWWPADPWTETRRPQSAPWSLRPGQKVLWD